LSGRRIVVLRPEPGASTTVASARALGLEATAIPLFEIEPVDWEAPDGAEFDGLLLTSANALRFGGEPLQHLRGLPVYAIGEVTAVAAKEAGFNVIATGKAGVAELLGSIAPDVRLLHLCGADRTESARSGPAITAVVTYRAKALVEPNISSLTGSVALIHSPRAGRRLAELVGDRSSISIAAISPAAAEAVGAGWKTVASAERPTNDALLALAARLCNNG
jgi:uroporphyrinogen-III synthase